MSCSSLNLIHYADDTTAFVVGDDVQAVTNLVNNDSALIQQWLQVFRLTLNTNKTSFMLIGSPRNDINHVILKQSIRISNNCLTRVYNANFLGITIDDQLNFKRHYENVLSKLSMTCGVMYKIKHFVFTNLLRTYHMSLGWSEMTYGVVIWGRCCSKTCVNKMQGAQNKMIKLIYDSHDDMIYRRNKLLPFRDTLDYFSGIKLHKELNFPVTYHFNAKVYTLKRRHNRLTSMSQNENITPPLLRKTESRASFIYQAISFRKTKPSDIKNSRNCNTFKRKLKNFVLTRISTS